MRLSTLCRLWLPLAISFELMMLEGPAIQAAIGRLPAVPLNLAAFGLTMSLSLMIESPIIMLISTAIALVDRPASYHSLRRFMILLNVFCTLVSGLVAFTPLFDFIAHTIMGQPQDIIETARPAMQIMLLWTAAIGWRRFYQGILVRYGHTRKVSWGTAVRLFAAVTTAYLLTRSGTMPGAQVAAWTLEVAVFTEAIATTLFALPIIRAHFLNREDMGEPLPLRTIWKFHAPLAATTLLTLAAQPITAAALARLPERDHTLAAWPVVYMILLVIRGWGLSMQEITIAQSKQEAVRPTLRIFAWLVGGVTSAFVLLFVFTPLLKGYMGGILNLHIFLHPYVYLGVLVGVLLPLLTAIGSWARGLLVMRGATQSVYRGMVLNLSAHGILLGAGVHWQLPGMWVAAAAFTVAGAAEYLYLIQCATREGVGYKKARALPTISS